MGGSDLAWAAHARTIYYNTGNGVEATHTLPYQVLKLALSKCGKAYDLEPSPLGKATEQRAREAIISGSKVDVAWLGAAPENDRQLLPVRIPVDGGLLGYRLLLIDATRQDQFSKVRSLADLKRLVALQGTGWPDIGVLRGAGLTVMTGEYKDLFRMLMVGRGDYFPRGSYEAFSERDANGKALPGLAVEKTLVLHYPLMAMFYVRRSNIALHDDIERGLKAAAADGSFRTLLRSNPMIRSALDQGDLKSRRLIEISDPYLDAQVRTIDPRFWVKP